MTEKKRQNTAEPWNARPRDFSAEISWSLPRREFSMAYRGHGSRSMRSAAIRAARSPTAFSSLTFDDLCRCPIGEVEPVISGLALRPLTASTVRSDGTSRSTYSHRSFPGGCPMGAATCATTFRARRGTRDEGAFCARIFGLSFMPVVPTFASPAIFATALVTADARPRSVAACPWHLLLWVGRLVEDDDYLPCIIGQLSSMVGVPAFASATISCR